jgi:NTE family protein
VTDPQNRTDLPVHVVETGSPFDAGTAPEPGIALCLSGGGYRAMVFHVGVLWRLNELGYLPKLNRVSSVSGGSLTAGLLGLRWNELMFDDKGVSPQFNAKVAEPVRGLAGETIDASSIFGGILSMSSISDKIADAYRKYLFDDSTLQDLPDRPRFVINATNVQSGALWRFSKPYMADYRVGMVPNPKVELAVAVAASSAFPPVLSPCRLTVDPATYAPPSGKPSEDLHQEPFLSDVALADGGVYDNLGLETAWKRFTTVLVSDGGGKMQAEAEPKSDWARHAIRINDIIDNQVRSLRKRQLIDSYEKTGSYTDGRRDGAYWGIRTDIRAYQAPNALPCDFAATTILASTPTRLAKMDAALQERLINWGYAVCDAAMRSHVDRTLPAPTGFPYPGGVG